MSLARRLRRAAARPWTADRDAPVGAIVVAPGDDWQTAATAAGVGATLFVEAGHHVGQSVQALAGQTWIGQRGPLGQRLVDMDGESGVFKAFRGPDDGVVVRGFYVHDYEPGSLNGAISGFNDGGLATDWTVQDCEIAYCGPYGIHFGAGWQVIDCDVHHCAVLGVNGSGADAIWRGGSSSWNNPDSAANPFFEAGGSKITHSTNLLVERVHVHHNIGPGIWTDIDNYDAEIRFNHCHDNWAGPGIFHEISGAALIHHNRCTDNGFENDDGIWAPRGWLWEAGILLGTAFEVEIYNNVVLDNFNGIGLVQQQRGGSADGADQASGWYRCRDVDVHHNEVSGGGATGRVQDYDPDGLFPLNITFDHNDYGGGHGFELNTGVTSFAAWRAGGYDLNGSYT